MLNTAQKAELVAGYAGPYSTLIETGLYNGAGTGMRLDRAALGFECYIAIDIQPDNVEIAARRAGAGDVFLVGNSASVLPAVLDELEAPALFWLDAHWNADAGDDEHGSPLAAELAAIAHWPHGRASTVLVDDIRLCGLPGWPTLTMLVTLAEPWALIVADDVARLTPR